MVSSFENDFTYFCLTQQVLSQRVRVDQGVMVNEGVLNIPQSSIRCSLVSYPEHSLGWGSYPSAEMQSAYSTATADWVGKMWRVDDTIVRC